MAGKPIRIQMTCRQAVELHDLLDNQDDERLRKINDQLKQQLDRYHGVGLVNALVEKKRSGTSE